MIAIQKISAATLALILVLALAGPGSTIAVRASACGSGPVTASVIQQVSADRWSAWIRQLSGAVPVQVGDQTVTLASRFTPAMFWGAAPRQSAAYEYVLNQVRQWYPAGQVSEQPYLITSTSGDYTAKNIILELTGAVKPDEIVVLSAHLDSVSYDPWNRAPGAEDNASGSAALLEAARLFSRYRFERTLQIIWFTGEEQGLLGSRAFTADLPAGRTIVADLNLDMYGYDADNDHCFELHVGTLPASAGVGQCIAGTIQANNLDLSYDYLTTQASGSSDHASFWNVGLAAVEVLENFSDQGQPGGCTGQDRNPFYHFPGDTIDRMNLASGAEITRVALASAANLAGPLEICFNGASPVAVAVRSTAQVQLDWSEVPGADLYRIWRSNLGCSAGWSPVGEVAAGSGLVWVEELAGNAPATFYQVEAASIDGCLSLPSLCAPALWPNRAYLPSVSR